MALNVVPFTPGADSSYHQQEVIKRLEEALDRARAGNIHSVAIVMHESSPDGGIVDCWHNGGQPFVMLGAIKSLKVDFLTACIQRR